MGRLLRILLISMTLGGALYGQYRVEIVTDSDNAAIYVEDSLIAYKGRAAFDAEKGEYTLRIFEDRHVWGSRSITDTINVNSADTFYYNFSEKAESDVVKMSGVEGSQVFPGLDSPHIKKKKFTDNIWFKVLLGSSAIFGGAAAYTKLKADDLYDEYEKTGDESTLDKTNTYDTLSAIFLGALEINFGVLIYFFLTE